MEQIGTLLTTDEAARSLVIGLAVYALVAIYRAIRKGETDSEIVKFKTAAVALVTAAVGTVLAVLGSNGWTFTGLSVVAVVTQIVTAWMSAMGWNAGMKRAAGLPAVTSTALLAVCVVALALFAGTADAAPGDWEARTYATVVPVPVEHFGAGAAVELLTIDPQWPILGALFGGHVAFADAIQLGATTALGGSVSTRPADRDDGWRWWAAVWAEGGQPEGAAGLSRAW